MALFPARRATISSSNTHTCCTVADSYSLWLGFLCPCLCLYADMLLDCCMTSHHISPAQAQRSPIHDHEGEKEKNAPRPPNKYPRSLDGMCGACAAVYSTGFGVCTALAASVMRERRAHPAGSGAAHGQKNRTPPNCRGRPIFVLRVGLWVG